jgi:phospholipid/cholesterol/gamma-HCH transport system substrate-binding protein
VAPDSGAAGRTGAVRATRRTGRFQPARVVTALALVAGLVLVLVVLFSGSSGHRYTLMFQTGGQLVKGNQVLVGGHVIGSVDDIVLTDDAQAAVKITTDQALHDGTTAVIRATGLSGVANHYVSLTPGPNNAPQIPNDGTITGEKTTTPVDLDQLFNTFTPRARKGLQQVIQGSATAYVGKGKQANGTYKFLAPSLTQTQRLFDQLTRDQHAFTEFLVSGGSVLSAIAERRNDLSALVQNANQSLGAIAAQNQAFDRTLVALPPFLRQANTTFVNLRAALDDVTPTVNLAKPATRNLTPFLRDLRPVAEQSVPVVNDLSATLRRSGPHNDTVDTLRELPKIHKRAHNAKGSAIKAFDASQPDIQFARPYAPDLVSWVAKLGESAGYYDADGHYVRVMPLTNAFRYDVPTQNLEATGSSHQYDFYDTNPLGSGIFTRCPGGATQPVAGSNPFLDGGNLAGKCDPSDVPPGP